MNKLKSYGFILFFLLLLIALGFVVSIFFGFGDVLGPVIIIVSVLISIAMYYSSDSIVLSLSGAVEADPKQYIYLHNTVEGLAIAAGIPKPRVYIVNDEAPNAFATGRDPSHSVICVTTGLLKKMNRTELEGVIAHEMSHIKNYDIRMATFAVVMVGSIALISQIALRSLWFGGGNREERQGGGILIIIGVVFAILAPIFATLVQLALSRKREFLADASGAQLTRYPEGLASALQKIASDEKKMRNVTDTTASLYIVNPLNKKSLANLFSTHPPIEERIAILRKM